MIALCSTAPTIPAETRSGQQIRAPIIRALSGLYDACVRAEESMEQLLSTASRVSRESAPPPALTPRKEDGRMPFDSIADQ